MAGLAAAAVALHYAILTVLWLPHATARRPWRPPSVRPRRVPRVSHRRYLGRDDISDRSACLQRLQLNATDCLRARLLRKTNPKRNVFARRFARTDCASSDRGRTRDLRTDPVGNYASSRRVAINSQMLVRKNCASHHHLHLIVLRYPLYPFKYPSAQHHHNHHHDATQCIVKVVLCVLDTAHPRPQETHQYSCQNT